MPILDWLTGLRRPPADTPPRNAALVRAALLAVNRDTAPFVVRPGGTGEPELLAEWRIVDAAWRQVFGRAGLSKVARVGMRLDPDRHEVRACDEEWSVAWVAGVPSLSRSATYRRGRVSTVAFGQRWAFTEQGEFGEVFRYRFASTELRGPLQAAVTGCGWTWRSVAFGAGGGHVG